MEDNNRLSFVRFFTIKTILLKEKRFNFFLTITKRDTQFSEENVLTKNQIDIL